MTIQGSETSIRSDSAEQCAVCSHAWESHDALGVRYCTATGASSLSRGCICG